jgi:hypothetical protein
MSGRFSYKLIPLKHPIVEYQIKKITLVCILY